MRCYYPIIILWNSDRGAIWKCLTHTLSIIVLQSPNHVSKLSLSHTLVELRHCTVNNKTLNTHSTWHVNSKKAVWKSGSASILHSTARKSHKRNILSTTILMYYTYCKCHSNILNNVIPSDRSFNPGFFCTNQYWYVFLSAPQVSLLELFHFTAVL